MATFTGTAANETITPTVVSPTVTTSGGAFPTAAADIIFGGDGNDYIFAVLGTPETIVGGAGIDTLDTTLFSGNYVVNLATGLTNFAGESFINMENLISDAGDDSLTGTTSAK